jgi:uncharacterized membrane protein
MKSIHWSQHWHHFNASHRLNVITVAGIVSFFLLASVPSTLVRLALSWIIASNIYLVISFLMMHFSAKEDISNLSEKEDDGAIFILIMTLIGSIASLVVIWMIMTDVKALMISSTANVIGLVLLLYASSWLLIHTAFALHYAHVYYQDYAKTHITPLIFPLSPTPGYVDFMYFSMVLGMTCQTADTNIANTRMRFLAMLQGVTAFIFNTALLVLTINLVYDLPTR